MTEALADAVTRALTRSTARELLAFEFLLDIALTKPDPIAYLAEKRAGVLAGLDANEASAVAGQIRRELEKVVQELSDAVILRAAESSDRRVLPLRALP